MSVLRRRGRGDPAHRGWSRNTALTLAAGASIVAAGVLVPLLLLGGASMLHWPAERTTRSAPVPLVVGGQRPRPGAQPASGRRAAPGVAPVTTPVILAGASVPQVTGPVRLPARVRARRNAPPASRRPPRTVAPRRPSVSVPAAVPAPVSAPPVAPAPDSGAPAPAPAVPQAPHGITRPLEPPSTPTPAPPAHQPPGTPRPVSTPVPPGGEPAPPRPPSPPTSDRPPSRPASPDDQDEDGDPPYDDDPPAPADREGPDDD